ncbi:DMT family transporter [Flavobacterium aquatile]|uniref:Permease n=1 Tax=Flavobacterium aquatile LMG 4008 = ATCC 11947 TaxID=1453498 RepID=A0A095U506_9FLAO|nr:DMT family transporter [Flavobacterium aquatile]KGD69723.1 permease [Flavobacterium aquatile LMG 4008 = ATCC 11947]OXA65283.1 EamA family transporter [Flavobacterium aquatile] [Flavobacterium aquatile LMG 4008 = ATCC 11947]
MLSDNTKSYLHLHLIVFIWGFTAILGALITLEAMPLVWFRMLFAVFFILIYIKWKKIPITVPKKVILKFLVAGLIIALHWFTFFRAIKVSNVSITLACLSTGAFFTSIIEPIFFKKKMVWYEIFFGLIVVFGLTIIFNVEGKYVEGIALALTSAFLSASFAVINSKFVQQYDATVISFYELSGGVLFFSVFLLFLGSFNADFFKLSVEDFVYLMILSSVCTAYAFIASTAVMKFLSPYTVMLTINLEPIYGIILAVLWFKDKEQMSPEFYIGAVIILITVIINGIIKSRAKAT